MTCQCEHTDHFAGEAHKYQDVPAGTRKAKHVGPICDACADTHMAPFLIEDA